ncbi:hypothetical protein FRB90_012476 [Tulasnella sp. 427]|nr:hypothetical protein FRB90_012476 [Tulasnella sp. 427]
MENFYLKGIADVKSPLGLFSLVLLEPAPQGSQLNSAIQVQIFNFLLPKSDGAAMRKIGGEPSGGPSQDSLRPTNSPSERARNTLNLPRRGSPPEAAINTTPALRPIELAAQDRSAARSSNATVSSASSAQFTPSSSPSQLAKNFNALQLSGTFVSSSFSSASKQWWDAKMEEDTEEDDGGLPDNDEMDIASV